MFTTRMLRCPRVPIHPGTVLEPTERLRSPRAFSDLELSIEHPLQIDANLNAR